MWSSLVNLVSTLMGNQFTQFCQALKHGQCPKADEMYFSSKKLREVILSRVNEPLGPEHDNNSVLHYVALHKMERLYIELLNSDHCPGVPDLKNSQRRNCFHLICLTNSKPIEALSMLEFTITYLRGQKVDIAHLLAEKDEDGNTVLHLAAGGGLVNCVDLLVSYEADMYATNSKEETAADVATRTNHREIATKLETQMVFSNDPGEIVVDTDPALLQELAEQPTGMQTTDLRSMKDQLLIETSEMLGVSLFTAEALLRNHGWSKEELLDAWMRDPADVCDKAGVQLPSSLGIHNLDEGEGLQMSVASTEYQRECGICCMPSEVEVQVPCEHHFCKDCWKEYLEGKIKVGEAHTISCPEYGCYKLVPLDVIESTVSREMAERFLNFDIKAFVDSNPNIRWCPHPGCGQAVALTAPLEDPFDPLQVDNLSRVKERSGKVANCGQQHYFCWDCLGEAHEPCSCEEWKKWLDLIEEMKPKVGNHTSAESNEAASFRWLASRSKPCPKCKVPIERTEGCNHMCCKKCKHDFCWVCLDNWGCHNSSTGGYFECNRYDAQKKAHEILTHRREQVVEEFAELERMGRFLHYFERYKGHGQSIELEEPFLHKARHKMEMLAISVQSLEPTGSSASLPRSRGNSTLSFRSKVGPEFMVFIEDAVNELLKDRRVLRSSYGFGFFIQNFMTRRQFENMQGALEQVTEYLAEVVARPHLRKPRKEIIRLTREAREKRQHLVRQVHIGLPDLLPPSLPPRRQTWVGGALDDSPPSGHSLDLILQRMWRGERERARRSPSPPPPSLTSTGGSRERRTLPSRLGRFNRNRSHDEDGNLRHILEMSRMEYEAEQQLNKDVELAKALSMQERQPSPSGSYEEVGDYDSQESLTPLHSVNSWLNIPNESREDTTWVDVAYPRQSHSPPSWPTWNLERRPPRGEFPLPPPSYLERRQPKGELPLPPPSPPELPRHEPAFPDGLLLSPTPPHSSLSPHNFTPSPNGDPVGLNVLSSPLQPATPDVPSPTRDYSVSRSSSPEDNTYINTNSAAMEEWGPLFGEEEDLRRAIQMSMAAAADKEEDKGSSTVSEREGQGGVCSGLTISGPQFLDYNGISNGDRDIGVRGRSELRTDHEIALPPELRHLLATSNRTGAHV